MKVSRWSGSVLLVPVVLNQIKPLSLVELRRRGVAREGVKFTFTPPFPTIIRIIITVVIIIDITGSFQGGW